MASYLENRVVSVMNCWHVYEQNKIVKKFCVDNWTAESAIIASNE